MFFQSAQRIEPPNQVLVRFDSLTGLFTSAFLLVHDVQCLIRLNEIDKAKRESSISVEHFSEVVQTAELVLFEER